MDPENRYALIKKKRLAVIYGLEKFYTYTYGRQVTVESDHELLVVIVKRPLHRPPKRIQHMRAPESSSLLDQPWL